MGRLVYRQEPGGFREYEIEFHTDSPDWRKITIGDYIRSREDLRLPTIEFKKCFLCGRYLGMGKHPLVLYVSGLGIRFSCSQCYDAEMNGGKTKNEKAVL